MRALHQLALRCHTGPYPTLLFIAGIEREYTADLALERELFCCALLIVSPSSLFISRLSPPAKFEVPRIALSDPALCSAGRATYCF